MKDKDTQLDVIKALAEFSSDWLMWLSDKKTIKYISPAVETITGYQPEEFIKDNKLIFKILHPADKPRILKTLKEEFKNPDSCTKKFRIIHKNGDVRWIEHRCRPVFDSNYKIIGRIIRNRDITRQATLEQTMLEMKGIVQKSTDAIMITDLDGNIEYTNTAFEKMTGYSFQEVKGKNPRILKSGKHSKEFYKELWGKITKGESWEGTLINKNKEGELYYEYAVIFPIKDEAGEIINFAKIARGVTSQEEIEHTLKQREKQLLTLINSTPDIICFKDGQGRWIEANEADLKLFQLESVDYRGKKDSELAQCSPFYSDAFLTCEQSDEIAWQKGTLTRAIEVIPRPDGSKKIYDVIKVPLFNEDGSRKGLVVLGRDITEMKEKEKALEESEKKYKELARLYRLMADNIPDLVWAKDLNGKYIFVNKAICEKLLIAKDTQEPIGKDDLYFANRQRKLHPERKDWHTFGELCINSDAIVIKNQKPQRFDEFGNVQGKFLYLDVYKAPIFDESGKMIGTVGHGRIVTKEKEMEKKLIESEKRYRRIFEESQDVIFISSKEGQFLDINPAGLKLFGYKSVKEIQTINIARDLFVNPKDREKYFEQIKKYGSVKDYELRLKKKDGSEITVLETSTAIYDKNNNIIAIRGIMRDITEQRELEKQLAQAQKMESIGTLAGGIAHDFNNLLTVINGYAEMLLMRLEKKDPLIKYISTILKAGKRAESLTRQLLAFSRKQIMKLEIININQVILDIDKMLRRLIDEDIQIEIKLGNNLPNIKADESQLEQIFINLIVNARDALRAIKKSNFQKKIIIETGQVFLDKEYVSKHPGSSVGTHIYFAVSDNGIGMDEDTKSKIFEPFFTTKEKFKGTGLGLSMVYGIVKQNKGSIYVYSEPCGGTTFKIFWPSIDEKSTVKPVKIKNERIEGNESILVVEDEESVRNFACESLNSLGYKTFSANNGRKALELVKNENMKIDLVVTDLVMPELNGKEFVDRLKEIYPDVKVIYVSGYADQDIVHNGFWEKNINFLQKPYSIRELASKIRKVLDEK